jgi:hypothetical protein
MKNPDQENKLEGAIRNAMEDGRLPCEKAFQIAHDLNLSKRKVGEACNRLKIKISRCQLGCFE